MSLITLETIFSIILTSLAPLFPLDKKSSGPKPALLSPAPSALILQLFFEFYLYVYSAAYVIGTFKEIYISRLQYS